MRKAAWSPAGDASWESSGIFRRRQLPGGGTGGMPLKGIPAPGLFLSLWFPSTGTVSSSTGSCCHNILLHHKPESTVSRTMSWNLWTPEPKYGLFPLDTLHQVFCYLTEERNWWPSTCLGYRLIAAPRSSRSEKLCHSVPWNLRLFLSVLEGKLPCGDHSVSASHQGCATC